MKQDILHIRDAVSKTITVTPQMMTIIGDLDHDEIVIPETFRDNVQQWFEFAYNRADDFKESKNGVMLNISGGQYPDDLGDAVHELYKELKSRR